MCVKITVNYEQDVRFFIPLEPSAPGDKAECPDNATAAQIAADYRGAVKAEAGVLDVRVVNTTCTWIVSGRGLAGWVGRIGALCYKWTCLPAARARCLRPT